MTKEIYRTDSFVMVLQYVYAFLDIINESRNSINHMSRTYFPSPANRFVIKFVDYFDNVYCKRPIKQMIRNKEACELSIH